MEQLGRAEASSGSVGLSGSPEGGFWCDLWGRSTQAGTEQLDVVWLTLLFSPLSFETQRNGLVFIYDMAGSQYTNFELDLSKKILNLLKVTVTRHLLTHLLIM